MSSTPSVTDTGSRGSSGDPALMCSSSLPMVSNIELVWEQELYRRALEYQGDHVRVTVFDKRGIGLSDRFGIAPTLEDRCKDMLAVMDAAGLEHATIEGFSEGGLMCQLFAVLHPDRVERLVLGNSNPGAAALEAVLCRPRWFAVRLDETIGNFLRLIETWGTDPQFFVDLFNPCQSSNAAFVRWSGRYCRQSATAADILAQALSFAALDAADRLAEIAVPTLITHDVDDRVMPFAAGEWLATQIPGAIFKEMPGSDHFGLTNPDWRIVVDAQLEFICGSISAPRTERRFATVVFTDIVGSTKRSASGGRRSVAPHTRQSRSHRLGYGELDMRGRSSTALAMASWCASTGHRKRWPSPATFVVRSEAPGCRCGAGCTRARSRCVPMVTSPALR